VSVVLLCQNVDETFQEDTARHLEESSGFHPIVDLELGQRLPVHAHQHVHQPEPIHNQHIVFLASELIHFTQVGFKPRPALKLFEVLVNLPVYFVDERVCWQIVVFEGIHLQTAQQGLLRIVVVGLLEIVLLFQFGAVLLLPVIVTWVLLHQHQIMHAIDFPRIGFDLVDLLLSGSQNIHFLV